MTQEVFGALPELGSQVGRAVLRWNKASRLMMRKTSTDIIVVFFRFQHDYVDVKCFGEPFCYVIVNFKRKCFVITLLFFCYLLCYFKLEYC